MLGRDVLVLQPLGLALRSVESLRKPISYERLAAGNAREALDVRDQRGLQARDGDASAFQQGAAEPAFLPEQGEREVLGLDGLLAKLGGHRGRALERLLGFFGELLETWHLALFFQPLVFPKPALVMIYGHARAA